MLISDSYSDRTSSTLPVIISFSSHLRTKKVKQIRDILSNHPNCQKYVKKGPNFVADGINEFRLYYVDSSLYSDDVTLKKLNVEKEEILFGTTSEDSLEQYKNPSKKREHPVLNLNGHTIPTKIDEKMDKATACYPNSCINLTCHTCVTETPKVIKKVSKSFQIGPDLRFNVVYVNTDIQQHSFNYKTTEASVQTEQIKYKNLEQETSKVIYNFNADTSVKIPIRGSPPFLIGGQSKPEKKNLTTFETFCSKMEERRVCKFTDDSEINVESRTTSVKYSIKKSPSFVANYILEILKRRNSPRDILNSEMFEQSIVNHIKYDDFKKRVGAKKAYDIGIKNEIIKCDCITEKYDRKSPYKCEVAKKNKHEHHTHRKKDETMDLQNKYTKNCNKIDKLRRYHNIGRSSCCKIQCLFKCNNMDFFLRRSHYAILKKYHRKLQENGLERGKHHHNHRHKKIDRKQTEDEMNKNGNYNRNEYNIQNRRFFVQNCQEIQHNRKMPSAESRTRTTISGFLQSFRPWHWQDNSKLSVCIDEECFTQDKLERENIYLHKSPYQCNKSRIRKYLNL